MSNLSSLFSSLGAGWSRAHSRVPRNSSTTIVKCIEHSINIKECMLAAFIEKEQCRSLVEALEGKNT